MDIFLTEWLLQNILLAAVTSILLNIIIAIIGFFPSTFITIGTVGVLGLRFGLIVLIIGEALGAIISFILYRKGVNKLSSRSNFSKNKFLVRLKNTDGFEAFLLVILLRLLPFIPSGLITLSAAFSKMNFMSFVVSSTLGKIPALFIEAYSVFYVLRLKDDWIFAILISVFVIFFLFYLWKMRQNL